MDHLSHISVRSQRQKYTAAIGAPSWAGLRLLLLSSSVAGSILNMLSGCIWLADMYSTVLEWCALSEQPSTCYDMLVHAMLLRLIDEPSRRIMYNDEEMLAASALPALKLALTHKSLI